MLVPVGRPLRGADRVRLRPRRRTAAVDRPGGRRRRGGAPPRRGPRPGDGGGVVAGRPVDRVHHPAGRRRALPRAVRTARRHRPPDPGGRRAGDLRLPGLLAARRLRPRGHRRLPGRPGRLPDRPRCDPGGGRPPGGPRAGARGRVAGRRPGRGHHRRPGPGGGAGAVRAGRAVGRPAAGRLERTGRPRRAAGRRAPGRRGPGRTDPRRRGARRTRGPRCPRGRRCGRPHLARASGRRAPGGRPTGGGPTADGYAVDGYAARGHPVAGPVRGPGSAPPGAPSSVRAGGGLAAYLIDPDGVAAPALVAVERTAATLRVCDVSRDGRLAVLRRGPRNRREAVVVRLAGLGTAAAMPVADGDPWVAAFSPDGRRLWLRSDADREFAALLAADLAPDGTITRVSVAAERPGVDLELLAVGHEGRGAFLAWNDGGVSALEFRPLPPGPGPDGPGGEEPGADRTGGEDSAAEGAGARAPAPPAPAPPAPAAPGRTAPEPAATAAPEPAASVPAATAAPGPTAPRAAAPDPVAPAAYADPPVVEGRRDVPLPHEVATRVAPAGPGGAALALSGSRRRPGVWWLPGAGTPLMTPWSSRDEDAVPPGRRPTRPVLHRFTAQDGMPLSGWYYRAPGRAPGRPAPCVLHLHGGPEEQERPVLEPLYHELLGRGFDVFAPDVRGSSGHGRSFVDADLGTGRFAAIQDVADCAAHAVLAGPADPSRLAVMGRSYGGYLVMASLVWHPELFRTGVAVCGMSDFQSFFAGTEPWIAESAAHKYGHPERDRELLRSLSPLHRVDALRVPVLAVHGEHDTNVPPGESEQFVRAARERGVAAELLTLRDEGHDFQRADNRRLFRRSAADWLERHLAGGGGGPAPFARREE
nr:prolyl oligopeptidase family serine peptidase [Streptomyces fradiae]